MNRIKIAVGANEISSCHPVMTELRPHLDLEGFVSQVIRQGEQSQYQLVYLSDGDVKAVAGVRMGEWLAGGRYLEIEDLVSVADERSKGYGGELFDWIVGYAKQQGCSQVRLVSHVTRFDAHRFYLNRRMKIEAHYFSMPI